MISRDAVILIGSARAASAQWEGERETGVDRKDRDRSCRWRRSAWVMLQLRLFRSFILVGAAGLFTFVSGIVYVMRRRASAANQGHANANGDAQR